MLKPKQHNTFIQPQPVVSHHLPGLLLPCLPASFQGWRSLDQIFMPSFAFYGKDIGSVVKNDHGEGCPQTETHQENWVCRWLSGGSQAKDAGQAAHPIPP